MKNNWFHDVFFSTLLFVILVGLANTAVSYVDSSVTKNPYAIHFRK